jgi:hypothetical protein
MIMTENHDERLPKKEEEIIDRCLRIFPLGLATATMSIIQKTQNFRVNSHDPNQRDGSAIRSNTSSPNQSPWSSSVLNGVIRREINGSTLRCVKSNLEIRQDLRQRFMKSGGSRFTWFPEWPKEVSDGIRLPFE